MATKTYTVDTTISAVTSDTTIKTRVYNTGLIYSAATSSNYCNCMNLFSIMQQLATCSFYYLSSYTSSYTDQYTIVATLYDGNSVAVTMTISNPHSYTLQDGGEWARTTYGSVVTVTTTSGIWTKTQIENLNPWATNISSILFTRKRDSKTIVTKYIIGSTSNCLNGNGFSINASTKAISMNLIDCVGEAGLISSTSAMTISSVSGTASGTSAVVLAAILTKTSASTTFVASPINFLFTPIVSGFTNLSQSVKGQIISDWQVSFTTTSTWPTTYGKKSQFTTAFPYSVTMSKTGWQFYTTSAYTSADLPTVAFAEDTSVVAYNNNWGKQNTVPKRHRYDIYLVEDEESNYSPVGEPAVSTIMKDVDQSSSASTFAPFSNFNIKYYTTTAASTPLVSITSSTSAHIQAAGTINSHTYSATTYQGGCYKGAIFSIFLNDIASLSAETPPITILFDSTTGATDALSISKPVMSTNEFDINNGAGTSEKFVTYADSFEYNGYTAVTRYSESSSQVVFNVCIGISKKGEFINRMANYADVADRFACIIRGDASSSWDDDPGTAGIAYFKNKCILPWVEEFTKEEGGWERSTLYGTWRQEILQKYHLDSKRYFYSNDFREYLNKKMDGSTTLYIPTFPAVCPQSLGTLQTCKITDILKPGNKALPAAVVEDVDSPLLNESAVTLSGYLLSTGYGVYSLSMIVSTDQSFNTIYTSSGFSGPFDTGITYPLTITVSQGTYYYKISGTATDGSYFESLAKNFLVITSASTEGPDIDVYDFYFKNALTLMATAEIKKLGSIGGTTATFKSSALKLCKYNSVANTIGDDIGYFSTNFYPSTSETINSALLEPYVIYVAVGNVKSTSGEDTDTSQTLCYDYDNTEEFIDYDWASISEDCVYVGYDMTLLAGHGAAKGYETTPYIEINGMPIVANFSIPWDGVKNQYLTSRDWLKNDGSIKSQTGNSSSVNYIYYGNDDYAKRVSSGTTATAAFKNILNALNTGTGLLTVYAKLGRHPVPEIFTVPDEKNLIFKIEFFITDGNTGEKRWAVLCPPNEYSTFATYYHTFNIQYYKNYKDYYTGRISGIKDTGEWTFSSQLLLISETYNFNGIREDKISIPNVKAIHAMRITFLGYIS